ncbi:uncharacterized protein [Solanum tuberosum]|uniref:uncharacterized protein n=1 Tax=Solanum tuberosum TaxID=4113 RepID=UPI000739FDFF|nr:PREDICTED: uncharacterized protein LOC107062842 [Solanum tuberosum]
MGPGLAQPPPEPVAAPGIQAMLVQIIAAIGGMQQAPAPAAPVPQGQPAPAAPIVQPDELEGIVPLREQKMLGVFLRLSPPRFSGAVGEDAHEFLLTYHERLQTLGVVESRGADFIAYQLDGPTRHWWYTCLETRPAWFPPVTWTEFSKAFLARFIPRSIRDQLRDQFARLEQGSMTVSEYEARFHELSRNAAMILPTKEETVRCFVRGLRLQLRIETQSLVSAGRSFLDVVDNVRTIEQLCHEAKGGSDKRARQEDSTPFKPLSKHRRVISTAILVLVPVLIGAEIVHRWVLLAGVADLQLSVDSPRGAMSVGC